MALREPLLQQPELPTSSPFRILRVMITIATVAIGSSLQLGYAAGVLNNLYQTAPRYLARRGNAVSLAEWSLVVSGFPIGGLVGSLLGRALLLQFFGRKTVLLLLNLFVIASSAIFMLGSTWCAPGYAHSKALWDVPPSKSPKYSYRSPSSIPKAPTAGFAALEVTEVFL